MSDVTTETKFDAIINSKPAQRRCPCADKLYGEAKNGERDEMFNIRRFWVGTVVGVGLTAMMAWAQPPGDQPPDNQPGGEVDPPSRAARLSFLAGSVSFQPAGVEDWTGATLNRPMTTGDKLWVDDGGRAELHIGTAAMRLNGHTGFSFLNLDDRTAQIQLSEGTIEVRVRQLDQGDVFEIDTPNLAFSLLRPGDYRVDVQPDGATTIVTTFSGDGEGTGGGQAFPVHPRQQARVTGTDSLQYDLSGAPIPDEFDDWCNQRDRREDQSVSARYVSREVVGYSDLDAYGDWRPWSEYGEVWIPRGVPVGWAPYHYGHWAWISPWGWTWVDDAPWGYAPFHYGRWAYVGSAWGWVPGPIAVRPVYAPALVAWIGGAHFGIGISLGAGVGWCPLGPREVYAPAYRASPAYWNRVNVSNTVVNRVTINNYYNNRTTINNVRYVNRGAPGGMTAMPASAMAGGRPVNQMAVRLSPEQMRNARFSAAPQVAPSRQAVLGRMATGSIARPPMAVMNRAVVARNAPPPPAPSFAAREPLLRASPGRPLAPAQERTLRENAPASHPMVRQAPPVRASIPASQPGNQPANQPGNQPGGFGRPIQPRQPAPNNTIEPRAQEPRPQFNRPAPEYRPPPVNRPAQEAQPPRQNNRPAPESRPQFSRPAPEVRPAQPYNRPAPEARPAPQYNRPAPEARPQFNRPAPESRPVQPARPQPEARPAERAKPQPEARPAERDAHPKDDRR
ncbi:MAG: DUF6600 domain-containing protein [Bryobacteraceae bacterium]